MTSTRLDDSTPETDWELAGLARLAWDVAVAQLAHPGHVLVARDDGTEETAEVLSLLEQLAEAVMPSAEHNGKVGGPASRPPAALGVVALLAEIGQEVRQCCRGHVHPATASLTEQVTAWVLHAEDWQHQHPEYVTRAAMLAADWVRQARLLLEPPPRYVLRGRACPLCSAESIQVWSDDEGDYVRRAALSIDPDRVAAVCGGCGEIWPLELWTKLASAVPDSSPADLHPEKECDARHANSSD